MKADEDQRYMQSCVNIERDNMEHEYTRVSADQAYWNAKYADALETYGRSKLMRQRYETLLQLEAREDLRSSGSKVTEAMIVEIVAQNRQLHVMEDRELDAEVEMKRVQGVCEAVRVKREMLVSLGAHIRSELQGDPLLRANARTSREAREDIK